VINIAQLYLGKPVLIRIVSNDEFSFPATIEQLNET